MRILGVVGYHNAGKTTLVEKLSEILIRRGLKVGYVKHDPKGHGVTDKEGSDTWRIFRRLSRVALISPDRVTLWDRDLVGLEEVLKLFFEGFDIVIVEGFKSVEWIPKIAIGDVEAKNVILRLNSLEDENLERKIEEWLEDFLL